MLFVYGNLDVYMGELHDTASNKSAEAIFVVLCFYNWIKILYLCVIFKYT